MKTFEVQQQELVDAFRLRLEKTAVMIEKFLGEKIEATPTHKSRAGEK